TMREMLLFLGVLEERTGSNPRQSKKLSDKVAILTESGTVYGGSFDRKTKGSQEEPEPFYSAEGFLTLPFPLHVAYLRGAVGARERGILSPLQRGHAPIPIDEVRDASDRVPSAAPRMTIAADGLVLERILATIRNESIRYVGIVATDVLDTIFLAGLI